MNNDNWPAESYVVKSIEPYDDGGFAVNTTDSSCFGVTKEEAEGKPLPKPGDSIMLLGGFGFEIQGIFIGGVQYRYRTRKQAEQKRLDWKKEYDQKKEDSFIANIDDWIDRKNALDEPFRSRIQRFEDEGFKKFWKESGFYELFVVEQANKLLNHAISKTLNSTTSTSAWLDEFYDLPYKDQQKAFPGLDDGHSGNTFGGMVGLAKAVARGENI